jgi:hypothetical protein
MLRPSQARPLYRMTARGSQQENPRNDRPHAENCRLGRHIAVARRRRVEIMELRDHDSTG